MLLVALCHTQPWIIAFAGKETRQDLIPICLCESWQSVLYFFCNRLLQKLNMLTAPATANNIGIKKLK